MGISSSNHFFVVLLALLCSTSAYASRVLVDNKAGEKNGDSLKKTKTTDQKWSSGGGPTCPGQGPGNCPDQRPGTCPGRGQCQGSCSGFVAYIPICQIPCGCSQENLSGGYSYGNGEWKKIEGPQGTHLHLVPTNGLTTHTMDRINSGVHNEAHVVTNGEPVKPNMEVRTQNPSETINEDMTHRVDMVNNEAHNVAHVVKPKKMVSGTHEADTTTGEDGTMSNEVTKHDSGVHNEAHVVTNGEPVKPNMDMVNNEAHNVAHVMTKGEPVKPNMKPGTHETTHEVYPPPTEDDEH